jgi:hypothetical protein
MFYPWNRRRAAPAALLGLFIASSIAPAIAKSPSVKITSNTTNRKHLIDDKATDVRLFPVIKALISDNTKAPVTLVSPIASTWNKYTEQKQSERLSLFQQQLAQLDIEDLPNGGIRVKGYSNQQLLRILQEAGYEIFSDEESIKSCQEFRLCSGQLKSRLLYISDPKNRAAIGQEAFDNGLRIFQGLISPARYEAKYGKFPIDILEIKGGADAVIVYFSVALRYKPNLRNSIIAALNKYPETFKILKGSLEALASKDEISSNSYTYWQQLLGGNANMASVNVPNRQSNSSSVTDKPLSGRPTCRGNRQAPDCIILESGGSVGLGGPTTGGLGRNSNRRGGDSANNRNTTNAQRNPLNQTYKSVNQLNEEIKRGKAPRGITRVDRGKVYGEQDHIHFVDRSALNRDGTWKHGGTNITKEQAEWLRNNGWRLPNQ